MLTKILSMEKLIACQLKTALVNSHTRVKGCICLDREKTSEMLESTKRLKINIYKESKLGKTYLEVHTDTKSERA